jgi:hypothetical protein
MFAITPAQVAALAGQVLAGELTPAHLSDTELTLVASHFLLSECALPPAALVLDEVARRMEIEQ